MIKYESDYYSSFEFQVSRWLLGCLYLWKRLAACLAGVLRHSPLFGKRHPHTESSLSLRWRRQCGWRAWNGIDSSGFTWLESFIKRSIPVYPSWTIVGRVKGICVRCAVRRPPSAYCADVHRRSWNWRRIRRLRWLGAVLLILPNNLHRCQYVEGIGRQVKIVETWRHYRVLGTKAYGKVGSLESDSMVTICGSGEATEEIVIVSGSNTPDSCVEFKITGVLFRIGLPSGDECST